MRLLGKCLVAAAVLSVATAGWAMAPAPAKIEPVLTHVPAGSLGFAVISNARLTAGKVDKFIAELGLDQFLMQPDPKNPGATVKASVLDLLKGAAQLGSGFNPDGGVAAVMLDPKAFGVDLLQIFGAAGMPGAGEGAAPGEGAAKAPPDPSKIPFVIFVPGKGIKEVFGAYEMEAAGKYTLIKLRMGPTYAAQAGGYIALSPNDKALDAALSASRKVAADLPAEHMKAINQADIAYYVDMKVAAPLIVQLLKTMEGQIVAQAGPIAPLMGVYMNFYREIIQQLDVITVAGRLVDTGLVFEELVRFRPDSTYGKATAAAKAGAGRSKLNRLPDLPYVLAVGGAAQTDEQSQKLTMDTLDTFLKTEFLAGLPEEEKQRLRAIASGMMAEITGMQMVGGGATAGKGLFGLSIVIECKDAAKVKALLAEHAKCVQGLVKFFGKDNEDIQKLSIRYVKDVETVGSTAVDAIVVEHPNLEKMEEGERAEMKKVLGEDKVRLLIASPNAKTVVVTFGGTRDFLAEALKVAGGTGTIGADADTQAAMKHLPADCESVVLLNGGNLFDLIVRGMKTMAPDAELPPFKLTCKIPVAMGVGEVGDSAHIVFYVPTQLVKDVAGLVVSLTAMRGGKTAPPAGGKDF